MDVLHIVTGLDAGGAERSITNLLTGGLATSTTHGVVSLRDAGFFGAAIRSAGVPLWCLNQRSGVPTPGAVVRLHRIVAETQPQTIQGWMYHGNVAARVAKSLATNKPRLHWNIRQSLYDIKREKPLTRLVIRSHRLLCGAVDTLVYNSYVSRRQHEARGIRANRTRVIVNGIDTQRFRPDVNGRRSVRSELGIADDALVVGHVARYHPMKDHAGFFRALGKLSDVDFHVVLAGSGVDPGNAELRTLVARVRQRVHILGEREDVECIFNAMDVFCLSSAWGEGCPNVVAEAMACGVGCVVTDVGDSAQLVSDIGMCVPAENADALARALSEMLSRSKDARDALGIRAREHVVQNYSLARTVEAYRELYEED